MNLAFSGVVGGALMRQQLLLPELVAEVGDVPAQRVAELAQAVGLVGAERVVMP